MTPPSILEPATEHPAEARGNAARLSTFRRVERLSDAFLRGVAERALDFLLPPHCVGCDTRVLRQGSLCPDCFSAITFIGEPFCDQCGLAFSSRDQTAGTCAGCVRSRPAFRRARAPFEYGEGIKRLILPFKHGDRPILAKAFAPHMARAGSALLAGGPMLVPVPLHRLRLFERRYNQAALLARAVADIAGCQTGLDVLRRMRATPSLDDRSAAERAELLEGAFAVRPRWRESLAGRDVVLIDDVMTSGATANACARVLIATGAANVDVLVAARVPIER